MGSNGRSAGQPWRWRRSSEAEPGIDAAGRRAAARPRRRARRPRPPPRPDDPRLPARPVVLPGHGQGRRRGSPTRFRPARAIAIFGDYDVDGATSAALLILLLRRLGAEPIVYIPDRLMEGYGPSGEALVELKARGASLVVTVDCGAQAFEALEQAQGGRARRDRRRSPPMRDACSRSPTRWSTPTGSTRPKSLRRTAISPRSAMAFLLGVALIRELRQRGFFARARRAQDPRPARPRRARHRRRRRPAARAQPRVRHPGAEGDGGAPEHRPGRAGRGGAAGQARRSAATSASRSGRGSTPAAGSASPISACAC